MKQKRKARVRPSEGGPDAGACSHCGALETAMQAARHPARGDGESHYRLLFQSNPCPMYILDERTLDFLDVNEAALRLYGYSRKAFLGMTVKDIRPPTEVPALVTAIRRQSRLLWAGTAQSRPAARPGAAGQTRRPGVVNARAVSPLFAGEWRHVKRDGSAFDAAITIGATRYAGREARLVLVNDITARKAEQAELQHRLEIEQLLATASSRLANVSRANLDAAADRVLADVGRLLCADRCYVFRVADDLTVADNTHEWCAPGIRSQIADLRQLPTATFGWMLQRMRDGEPLNVPRVADLPPQAAAERKLMAEGHVQSVILVPIRHGGRLIDLIGCDAVRGERQWSAAAIDLLRIVGEALADAQVRCRADEAVRSAAREWQGTFDSVADAVWVLTSDQRILRSNKAAVSLFGKSMSAMLGRPCWEIVHGTAAPIPECPVTRMMRSGKRETMELTLGERWYQVVADPVLDPQGAVQGAVHIVSDITARKQTEAAMNNIALDLERRVQARTAELRTSMEQLQRTLSAAHAIAWELDLASGKLTESGDVAKLLDKPEGFRHRTQADFFKSVHPEDRAGLKSQMERAIHEPAAEHAAEFRFLHPDGSVRWLASTGSVERDAAGRPIRLRGITRETTAQKQAETVLARTHRALRVLTECGHALLRASKEHELLSDACRIAVETGGYRMAWVGYAEHDGPKSVRPMAQVGRAKRYLSVVKVTWDDSALGRGPVGTAIRTGKPSLCRDVAHDPLFAPWRREALRHGCASVLALPLLSEQGCLGALAIYADQTDAFDETEVGLLQQLAGDLSFRILALRGRAERGELERRILDISEREQRRLGQDLHDGVGQSIIGIGYLISAVQQALAARAAPEAADLERVGRLIGKAVKEVREMAEGLFPGELSNGRIAEALQELARHTEGVFGPACRFVGRTDVTLPDANVASQVYRIAQEAVNNAAKHSKSDTIGIGLSEKNRCVILTVRDEGIGLPKTAGKSAGMGQRTMKYRAGMIGATLNIDSVSGKGTTVTCVIPKTGSQGGTTL